MSITDVLSEMSYSELLDLLGQLTRFYPDHELTPWIEQELELREEQMRWAIEEMHNYAREQCENGYGYGRD